jgi:hypothetical protein
MFILNYSFYKNAKNELKAGLHLIACICVLLAIIKIAFT